MYTDLYNLLMDNLALGTVLMVGMLLAILGTALAASHKQPVPHWTR